MEDRDKIEFLDERKQSREKVSIFFGSRSQHLHPFKEILLNGVDEIKNNFDSGNIKITLVDEKTLSIKDSGRGMLLSGETHGKPNYYWLLCKLFAGTNYKNGKNGKITTGTNGVGATVTNYCSTYFKVISKRKDETATISFKDGGEIVEPLKVIKEINNETGTEIIFTLDDAIFGDFKYDINDLLDIIKYTASISNTIDFYLINRDKTEKIHYDKTIDYFEMIENNNTTPFIVSKRGIYKNIVEEIDKGEVEEIDYIDLILTTSSEPMQKAFLNSTYLVEGGTINNGVVDAVKDFTNKYIEDKKMIDKKLGKISKNDVISSISFLCSVNSTVSEFKNQTKLMTEKELYKKICYEHTTLLLESELIENPKVINKMIKHILEVQSFNTKAKKEKAKLKKKLTEKIDNINNKIEKLTDCEFHGLESEIYICEGDSAKGCVVLARESSEYQAVLAIRGKILNVLKNEKKVFANTQNNIIIDILRALGCGIEGKKNKDLGEFNINNLRYGKIFITTDADADGEQIACLILALLYKYTPTLIKQGRVYIVNTPLYEVRLKDDTTIYWFTEKEKEDYLKVNGDKDIKHLARAKGLGELQPEVMNLVGTNPETRNITRVTIEDVEKMDKAFKIWLDEDVKERKDVIMNNFNKEAV